MSNLEVLAAQAEQARAVVDALMIAVERSEARKSVPTLARVEARVGLRHAYQCLNGVAITLRAAQQVVADETAAVAADPRA